MQEIQEIQSNISELEAQAEQLRVALRKKQEENQSVAIEHIKDFMRTNGLSADIVIAAITPAKAKKGRKPGNVVSFPRYVDPSNPDRVYVRGVLPAWMKEAMVAAGLDPANKDDREQFKADHLVKEAA